MTAAHRIELERGFQIRIELSGAILIVDVDATPPEQRDGVLLLATRDRELAEAAVAAVAVRCRDGNGWVLRWPWHGGMRDQGELTAKLAQACVEESARRGAR